MIYAIKLGLNGFQTLKDCLLRLILYSYPCLVSTVFCFFLFEKECGKTGFKFLSVFCCVYGAVKMAICILKGTMGIFKER